MFASPVGFSRLSPVLAVHLALAPVFDHSEPALRRASPSGGVPRTSFSRVVELASIIFRCFAVLIVSCFRTNVFSDNTSSELHFFFLRQSMSAPSSCAIRTLRILLVCSFELGVDLSTRVNASHANRTRELLQLGLKISCVRQSRVRGPPNAHSSTRRWSMPKGGG